MRVHLLLCSPCSHSQPQSAQPCHTLAGPCPSLPGIPGLLAPWGSDLQPRPGEGVWGLGWAAAAAGGAGIPRGHQVRSPGSVWPGGPGWPADPRSLGSEELLRECVCTWARGLSGPRGGQWPRPEAGPPPPRRPLPVMLEDIAFSHMLLFSPSCSRISNVRPDKADKHASRPRATPASTFPRVIKMNAADNWQGARKRCRGPQPRYRGTGTGLSARSGNR